MAELNYEFISTFFEKTYQFPCLFLSPIDICMATSKLPNKIPYRISRSLSCIFIKFLLHFREDIFLLIFLSTFGNIVFVIKQKNFTYFEEIGKLSRLQSGDSLIK